MMAGSKICEPILLGFLQDDTVMENSNNVILKTDLHPLHRENNVVH